MAAGDLTGRVAALDLGEAFTGVAVSDTGAKLARPLEVVPSASLEDYLARMIAAEGVSEVVVGVPKTLGGEIGFQARRALSTLNDLEQAFPATHFIPWDERFTTRVARSAKKSGRGRKRGKGPQRVDHVAAAAMLQEYLNRRPLEPAQ